MGEEAQRIEPMIDGDDDNAARGETRAVVARLGAGADDEAAAMNPDHHRQARAVAWSGRRPNVEMKAILGGRGAAEVDIVPHDALHANAPRTHRVGRTPVQAGAGSGGRQRNRPIGGAA